MVAYHSQRVRSALAAGIVAIALMSAPTASRAQEILLGGVGPLSQPGASERPAFVI